MTTTRYTIVVTNLKDHKRTRTHHYRVFKTLKGAMNAYAHYKTIVDRKNANGGAITIKIKNLANNRIVFAE